MSEHESQSPTKRNPLWRFLRIAVGVYFGLCIVMMALESRLVYPRPRNSSPSDWKISQADQTDVMFAAEDGVTLHGWFFAHEDPDYAILYCHGNGENISHNAAYMSFLRERLKASIFIFDYRGYGKSNGSPDENGLILDGLAAQMWLADNMQIELDEVVLMGRSLGGGVAVAVAAKRGARALALQNTFAAMWEVAAEKFPWLPVQWIMSNRYPSADRIKQYQGPLIQIHGTEDRIVPYTQGKKLFAAAPGNKKLWIDNPDQGHNQPLPRSYFQALAEFLKETAD